MQFRPAVDSPFDKPGRLNRLQTPVIVEIREPAIPPPATSRQPVPFAHLRVRRNTFAETLLLVRTDEQEVAFVQAEIIGNVADVQIERTILVYIGEIQSHPFEGIFTQRERFGRHEASFSLTQYESRIARRGS